jgi:two-component system sensor histidine kinase SenX3
MALACAYDGERVAIRSRAPGASAASRARGAAARASGSPATRRARGARFRAAQQPTRLPPGIASVLSVLSSSAVVVDGNGRVLRASAAARAFGLVKGDRLMVSELAALARQVRRDGEIREGEFEVPVPRFGGRTTSFAVRVAPLGGTVGGGLVLLLAEDQTESRRVDEVKRDFVANTSHELKTPVGALALLAETIEDAADDAEAVRRFAAKMRQEAQRLTNLVQDLITLSRIQAVEPVPDPRPVPLDMVVAEAVDRCRMKANARGIALTSVGTHGLCVLGDEDLLVTALRNLLENAVAYSPEQTRVVITTKRASDTHAELSVTDQGIGIPERDLERIFERFYRVDPARSRATGGTGLGLAIVKHVMAAHNGKVTVRSAEGAGSTFTLFLPLRGEQVGAGAALTPETAESNSTGNAQEAPK